MHQNDKNYLINSTRFLQFCPGLRGGLEQSIAPMASGARKRIAMGRKFSKIMAMIFITIQDEF